MLRMTENTRMRLMMIHGLVMVGLGLALFYVRATMTNAFFYIFGSAFALLLIAGSLLFIACIDWICAAGLGMQQVRRLRGFLTLSTAVAGGSLVLISYPRATMSMLCYGIALYALLLSFGKFVLARSWKGTRPERATMYLLASAGPVFAGALLTVGTNDDRYSLALLATYSLFTGLQMLLTLYFMDHHVEAITDSLLGSKQLS